MSRCAVTGLRAVVPQPEAEQRHYGQPGKDITVAVNVRIALPLRMQLIREHVERRADCKEYQLAQPQDELPAARVCAEAHGEVANLRFEAARRHALPNALLLAAVEVEHHPGVARNVSDVSEQQHYTQQQRHEGHQPQARGTILNQHPRSGRRRGKHHAVVVEHRALISRHHADGEAPRGGELHAEDDRQREFGAVGGHWPVERFEAAADHGQREQQRE